MSPPTDLSSYLSVLLGPPQSLRRLQQVRLKGLPVFLSKLGRFHEWGWREHKVILIEVGDDAASIAPSDWQAWTKLLSEHFAAPVAFVFPAMDAQRRARLVKQAVPFVVPGSQFFLPPFANLVEQFQRTAKVGLLSGTAQLAVLYQIVKRPPERTLLTRWAEWLGVSPMTMTKARDELVGSGLCEREPGAKPRGLVFLHQGRNLWDKALPVLRNPVRESLWLAGPLKPLSGLPCAGLTALARNSLIEDDVLPTHACRNQERAKCVEGGALSVVPYPEEAAARLQLWRYDPGLLARDGCVDPLSLFLSLQADPDERIRLAAGSLLEQVSW